MNEPGMSPYFLSLDTILAAQAAEVCSPGHVIWITALRIQLRAEDNQ